MNLFKSYDIRFWEKKVDKIVQVSKRLGYPEQDREFWERQPAGVISLILEIESKANREEI